MAKTLSDLHPAYLRKYNITTLKILTFVVVISDIARSRRHPSSATTLRAAPVPRHVKVPGPDVALRRSGFRLIADVGAAVLPVRDSPPLTNEPAVQIGSVLMTDRKGTAIAVDIAHCAADLSAPDPVGERQHCLLSAPPMLAFGRGAKLPAFRGIDPMQPDPLPSDFQCVAVDHAGNACQTIGMGLGDGKKGK
jgi:hypothetical protein